MKESGRSEDPSLNVPNSSNIAKQTPKQAFVVGGAAGGGGGEESGDENGKGGASPKEFTMSDDEEPASNKTSKQASVGSSVRLLDRAPSKPSTPLSPPPPLVRKAEDVRKKSEEERRAEEAASAFAEQGLMRYRLRERETRKKRGEVLDVEVVCLCTRMQAYPSCMSLLHPLSPDAGSGFLPLLAPDSPRAPSRHGPAMEVWR